MRLHGLITVAALVAACGFLAAPLDGYFAGGAAGEEDLLGVLLGEMRSVLGDMALVRADDYFHRGIRHVECTHFEGLGGDMEDEHRRERGDYIGRLNEAIHPAGHVHLDGGSLREMFPMIGAAIALDPNKEEAYLTGAYWLERVGKSPDAIDLLQRGVKKNPDSYLLYTDLGRYLFTREKDDSLALKALERALSNWNACAAMGDDPEQLARVSILLYMGAVFEKEGRPDEAIGCYEDIIKQFPARKGLLKKIKNLRRENPVR
ncbi:MAG: tetratricopeptide repeat protein [Candidatus Tritonobacter lacicola]|nr:tetratricopeptide repeat protein [Candidatus Tritonobacter lacicola]